MCSLTSLTFISININTTDNLHLFWASKSQIVFPASSEIQYFLSAFEYTLFSFLHCYSFQPFQVGVFHETGTRNPANIHLFFNRLADFGFVDLQSSSRSFLFPIQHQFSLKIYSRITYLLMMNEATFKPMEDSKKRLFARAGS